MKKVILFLVLIVMTLLPSLCNLAWTNEVSDTPDTDNNAAAEVIDRRKYERYNNKNLVQPITIKSADNRIEGLIDISRGGVALKHNKTLKAGDIVPINIVYGDMNISTEAEIIMTSDSRAGAKYTDLDYEQTKQLLYLTILLEYDNHLLKTKLSS